MLATETAACRQQSTAHDAFRQRMEAQCAQIERHRLKMMQQQGRVLSDNEAAIDWIEHHAEAFDSDYQPS